MLPGFDFLIALILALISANLASSAALADEPLILLTRKIAVQKQVQL